MKGFSPVCVRMCVVKLNLVEHTNEHTVHTKGFSPEWVRKWTTNVGSRAAEYGHKEHLKGFARVRPQMDFQVGRSRRRIRAEDAHKGLFVRMRHGLTICGLLLKKKQNTFLVIFFFTKVD